jgi:hypothetical protein
MITSSNDAIWWIEPPEGKEFKECPLCKNIMIDDGTSKNCIYCEINKKENYQGEK